MIVDENNNYIKQENPYLSYDGILENDILKFSMQIAHMKNIYRQGWVKGLIGKDYLDKGESIADHSFSVAMLAISMIEKYNLSYDINKCIKLCLVHELGEIYAGDFCLVDAISKQDKHILEEQAVQKLLHTLDFPNDFFDLWNEFETNATPEANFIKQLDGLDCLIQAACYGLDISFMKKAASKIQNSLLLSIVEELKQITKGKQIPTESLKNR